jgi:hypothetical protein
MKRKVIATAVATAYLVGIGTYAALAGGMVPQSMPRYTVAQVAASLLRNPAQVTGRTIQIEGVVLPCPQPVTCDAYTVYLVDSVAIHGGHRIRLEPGSTNTLSRALSHIPILDTLLPLQQRLVREHTATYSVRLRAEPYPGCRGADCFAAQVPNALPEDFAG